MTTCRPSSATANRDRVRCSSAVTKRAQRRGAQPARTRHPEHHDEGQQDQQHEPAAPREEPQSLRPRRGGADHAARPARPPRTGPDSSTGQRAGEPSAVGGRPAAEQPHRAVVSHQPGRQPGRGQPRFRVAARHDRRGGWRRWPRRSWPRRRSPSATARPPGHPVRGSTMWCTARPARRHRPAGHRRRGQRARRQPDHLARAPRRPGSEESATATGQPPVGGQAGHGDVAAQADQDPAAPAGPARRRGRAIRPEALRRRAEIQAHPGGQAERGPVERHRPPARRRAGGRRAGRRGRATMAAKSRS